MGLFSRAPRSRLPADMPRWLEMFGRHSLDPQHSGIDSNDIGTRIAWAYQCAQADRAGFLAELRALVERDQGGFATFGAARLVWEVLGENCLRIPDALPLVDAGIRFKRSRGLPTAMLTGYEMQRLAQLREQAG